MSWLRVDDGFTNHPKFEGWSYPQRWALLELLVYCARFRTAGKVPADMSLLPRAVTPKLLKMAVESGFIDRLPDGLWIHDWEHYNPRDPTAAQRMQRYRERNRDVTEPVTTVVENGGGERNNDRNEIVTSRARLRARPRPVPTVGTSRPSVPRARDPEPDGLTDISQTIEEQLGRQRSEPPEGSDDA